MSTIERKASSHRRFFDVLSYLNPSALPVCTPQRCTRKHTQIRGLQFTTRHLELCQHPITFAAGAPFLSSSTQSPQSFHGSARSIRTLVQCSSRRRRNCVGVYLIRDGPKAAENHFRALLFIFFLSFFLSEWSRILKRPW